ncbi:MAG: PH domain-containing protein [Undibacterium sp.]
MEKADFSRYHFQGQRESEVVLRIVHRHWFDIATHFFVIIIFLAVLFGSFSIMPMLFPEWLGSESEHFVTFIRSSIILILWLYAFLIWIDYFFDVWIITNERVVNIEQKGLFVRTVSELKFSRIQDVTSEVSGMIPTILNFGDVKVQTASEEDFFLFRRVPDPYHVKDVIMERLRTERDDEINRIVEASRTGKKVESL